MATNLDVLGGLDDGAAYKIPCACATTADMTGAMIGLPVIDGYQTKPGDRVLVWMNSDQTTNGVYDIPGVNIYNPPPLTQPTGTSAWTRSIDFTNSTAVYLGTQVMVVNGATYAGWIFVCQQQNPVFGAQPITFATNTVQDAQAKYWAEIAEAAASTAQSISNLDLGVWATRNAFALANIDPGVTGVALLGLATPGDCDLSVMVRLSIPPLPVQPWHTQTADGAWWLLRGGRIDCRWFGADAGPGNNVLSSIDSTTAINNALAFCAGPSMRRSGCPEEIIWSTARYHAWARAATSRGRARHHLSHLWAGYGRWNNHSRRLSGCYLGARGAIFDDGYEQPNRRQGDLRRVMSFWSPVHRQFRNYQFVEWH